MKMKKLSLWIAATLIVCAIVVQKTVAHTEHTEVQNDTIVFMPQWTAQAQFAGYYVAETMGFYREAGVKVRIEHPSATLSAMERLRR